MSRIIPSPLEVHRRQQAEIAAGLYTQAELDARRKHIMTLMDRKVFANPRVVQLAVTLNKAGDPTGINLIKKIFD